LELFECLINAGADVNQFSGEPLLGHVTSSWRFEIYLRLLDLGIHSSEQHYFGLGSERRTAISNVVCMYREELARFLDYDNAELLSHEREIILKLIDVKKTKGFLNSVPYHTF
jgi:hypothetical protein